MSNSYVDMVNNAARARGEPTIEPWYIRKAVNLIDKEIEDRLQDLDDPPIHYPGLQPSLQEVYNRAVRIKEHEEYYERKERKNAGLLDILIPAAAIVILLALTIRACTLMWSYL